MNKPRRRRWWLASLIGLLVISPESLSGEQKAIEWVPPTSLSDPRLEVIRLAAPRWEARKGPHRQVVDQVCLVPDLSTFFDAIATWDEGHFFPILIDDAETSLRFIRAFRPARIVRLPRSSAPITADQTWDRAIDSVAASWTNEAIPAKDRPKGDQVPSTMGPIPPGFVFSSPDAPMLAGAVTLSAGHFQPLVRFDFPKKFADLLSLEEAESFDAGLTTQIKDRVTHYDGIADQCDFLTIAGDWPYAYRGADTGIYAVDDKIARRNNPPHRWAWAGRLLGNSKESVYRAMCSLFLQPETALMFNGYQEDAVPWSDYSMRLAATRLNTTIRTSHSAGDKEASLEGWHEVFDPINRFGLVLINSHGMPSVFGLRGEGGTTSDIPPTVPTAVIIIHSYSAANPYDPDTVAGRWLANGSYLYFGSMHEPFLQSFRLPRLVAEMIGERFPFVVAARTTMSEFGGQPWRQVFLGDPLYCLKTVSERNAPRLAVWNPTEEWPAYTEPTKPPVGTDVQMFLWAFKTVLARLQGNLANRSIGDDLIDVLSSINRSRLPADLRTSYDALMVDVLLNAKRLGVLKARFSAIPKADQSPQVRRTLEWFLASDLNSAIARHDASAARTVWRELMKFDGAKELKEQASKRVGNIADTQIRREDWRKLLRSTLNEHPKSPEAPSIATELKRVEEALKADR